MSAPPKHAQRFHRLVVTEFHVGDQVSEHGHAGTVVGCIDTGEYSAKLRPQRWDTLGKGVLIQWADGSVTHVREPGVTLRRR